MILQQISYLKRTDPLSPSVRREKINFVEHDFYHFSVSLNYEKYVTQQQKGNQWRVIAIM